MAGEWVAVIGTAVGAIGATGAAFVAAWAGRRQTAVQALAQQNESQRQLRRDTYGALLRAGAEARDELGSLFALLRGARNSENLERLTNRLHDAKALINATRLATATVIIEGPDSVIESARRVEEGLVLFHSALGAAVTAAADSSGAFAEFFAICGRERVNIRDALTDFATAAREALDGVSQRSGAGSGVPATAGLPLAEASARQPITSSALPHAGAARPPEELDRILAGMAHALGVRQDEVRADATLWENGMDSMSVLIFSAFLLREHALDVSPQWLFRLRDQSIGEIAAFIATAQMAGQPLPGARSEGHSPLPPFRPI
ncbi:acyl carrier protein [Streptomyces sp. NPDC056528]|uniref:acyl carrier protein n=1 Tax=Streptomyces sp. NPDC056528 TaxID=3345854 RepID=UPI00369ED6BF